MSDELFTLIYASTITAMLIYLAIKIEKTMRIDTTGMDDMDKA